MAHYPLAKWVPYSGLYKGGPIADPVFGLLLHITDGAEVPPKSGNKVLGKLEFLRDGFDHNHNSVHFGIAKSGETHQFVDTDQSAKALGGGWPDSHWISVENLALPGELLTPLQISSLARLYAWLVITKKFPLRSVNVNAGVADFDGGKERGLGGHSMYRDSLRAQCPGAGILAQRDLILTMVAKMGVGPGPVF